MFPIYSGNNKTETVKKLNANFSTLELAGFQIYNGAKEWEHDLDPDFYKQPLSLNQDELNEIGATNNFLKLAIKFPIDPLEAVEEKLLRNFELLVRCCC